jgi:hypothetical protein
MGGRVGALLLIPALAFSADVVKVYDFVAPEVHGGAIALAGCRPSCIAFAPDVPVKNVVLLLPDGQKAVSYHVEYGAPTEFPGTFSIRPFRPGGRLSSRPPADYLLRKSAVYLQDRYFPAAPARPGGFSMQYKNGHPLFIAKVNPVQYNPATGRVRYYPRITVTVATAASGAIAASGGAFARGAVAALIDNKEAAAKLAGGTVSADDYEYCVVTTNALKGGFGEFIDFNRRRCLRTRVATVEDIRVRMPGADDQEKIRNYIKQEYAARNIVYVLLAGDAEPLSLNRVPHRGLRAAVHDYGDTVNPANFYDDRDIPADMYYGCLDGTWQKAGSQDFGEYGTEDLTAEVYVARFPADNAAELLNMIRKTIAYSEHPVAGGTGTALLAGEFLWGPPGHPVTCYGDFEMEQLIGVCTANNYTTVGFPPAWTFAKLYAQSVSWSGTDFINVLKSSGASWVEGEGHGNSFTVFNCWDDQVTAGNFPQNGTDADYFFISSGACYSGAFDNRSENPGSYYSSDCIGEAFVKLPTGAVAGLFNSRWGFADDGANGSSGTDGSNQRLRRYFHDAVFSKGIHYIEMMNAYSKEVNAPIILDPDINKPPYTGQLKWCAYESNVLGDPALSLWTEAPSVLSPQLPQVLTSALFSLRTPPCSWVALADADGAIICTQLTDSAGECSIQNDVLSLYLQAHPSGTLKVFIKAHNYYPYSGEVQTDVPVNGPGGGDASGLHVVITRSVSGYELRYRLPERESVRCELFNAGGELVRRVGDRQQAMGWNTVLFSRASLRSGIYYYRVTAGSQQRCGKFPAVK